MMMVNVVVVMMDVRHIVMMMHHRILEVLYRLAVLNAIFFTFKRGG